MARAEMDSKQGLKEILDDLKSYFEFQKVLGVEAVAVIKEKKNENPPVGVKKEPAPAVAPERKITITIEEQQSIFDKPSKKLSLEEIRAVIGDCTRCTLHEKRNNIVFGEGNPKAKLFFIGEGPGEDEDKQGRPFVGRAGQLLTKIIIAMGLKRSDVYIANVVKCRPPGNRVPTPEESATCEPFLFQQIRAVDPQVIVCLGNTAAQSFLKTKEKMGNLRGKFISYGKTKVMVTYHPAALLRNPAFKKPLWDDMQIVMKELGIEKTGD